MKPVKKNGFSLLELLVVIGISSIMISSLFYLFNNINILTSFTQSNSSNGLQIAYFYNLLKDDLSNSIPGIINDEQSIYVNGKNDLIIHRAIKKNKNNNAMNFIKIKWSHLNGKLFRSISYFGDNSFDEPELMFDYGKKISFKPEKMSDLNFISRDKNFSISIVSIVFGNPIEEIFTFKVGNN